MYILVLPAASNAYSNYTGLAINTLAQTNLVKLSTQTSTTKAIILRKENSLRKLINLVYVICNTPVTSGRYIRLSRQNPQPRILAELRIREGKWIFKT